MVFGKRIKKPESVAEGELMVVNEGIKLAVERNIKRLIVASDSNLAVQAVTQSRDNLSYLGLWATEIQSLNSRLSETSITHIWRSANTMAHQLAKCSSSFPYPFIWENMIFPCWLQDLVTSNIS